MLNKKVVTGLPLIGYLGAGFKSSRGFLSLVAILFLSFADLTSQEAGFTPSKDIASGFFTSGNYADALRHYIALSENFPADPLYKYYSGVCMVMTGMDPVESTGLLEKALSSSSQLRPVPGDVVFYLGRSYQQAGKYNEAINYFESFKGRASKKEIRQLNVDRYISECSSGSGSIIGLESKVAGNVVVVPDSGKMPEEEMVVPAKQAVIPVKQERDTLIDPGYDSLAREALLYQFRADSVIRLADRYRGRLKDLSGNEKLSVEKKILQLEQLGFEYQAEADKKFKMVAGMAGVAISPDSRSEIGKTDQVAVKGEEKESADSLNKQRADTISEVTAAAKNAGDTIPGAVVKAPVLAVFSDDYSTEADIKVNPVLPGGLVYRIQVAAFRNPVQQDLFKSLGPVYGIKAANSDITFYFIGLFRSKSDADRAVGRVRSKGFNDAFVIAVLDGERISLERAESVEPEWKNRTLSDGKGFVGEITGEVEPPEPQTLVFRIEVKKVTKPLTADEIGNIKRVAGTRPVDIFNTPDKKIVYLIGKFITFESAATYSDLLYRNGMKEAKVVAYLGDTEIPLEKARELFELYFNKQAL